MKFKDREKGYSLIWRADRNRFLLKWRAPDGSPIRWPSKMLPDEFNREEHRRAALHWVENFLPTATVKAFVRKPGPRTGGLRVAEIETSWLKIQKERVDNNKIAPSTYGNYVTHLKRHIVPLLGTRRPYECDVPALLAFVRELPKRLDPRSKKPIGANHCWNILKTLTVFLDGCQDEGFVPAFTNYARSKRVLDEMPARTKSNPVALAVAAAQALIDCTDVPFIRRVKYALAFTSSMADGEISGLNIGDIDLGDVELPTASIKRACRAEGKEGHAEIGPPKNEHRLRVVPLHSAAVGALKLWLAEGYKFWTGSDPSPELPLFPGLDGEYSRTDAAEHIRQDLRACGLPDKVDGKNVDFHATRRSCATWLDELGADERHRKRLMGHAVPDVTDKNYTRKTRAAFIQLCATVELIPLRWSSTLVPVLGSVEPSESESSMDSAPPRRLERPTNGLGNRCSIH